MPPWSTMSLSLLMVNRPRSAAPLTQDSAGPLSSSRGRSASRSRAACGEKPTSSIWRRISVLTGSVRAASPQAKPANCCSTIRRSVRISSITAAGTTSASGFGRAASWWRLRHLHRRQGSRRQVAVAGEGWDGHSAVPVLAAWRAAAAVPGCKRRRSLGWQWAMQRGDAAGDAADV
jgi:hypothetical protein